MANIVKRLIIALGVNGTSAVVKMKAVLAPVVRQMDGLTLAERKKGFIKPIYYKIEHLKICLREEGAALEQNFLDSI